MPVSRRDGVCAHAANGRRHEPGIFLTAGITFGRSVKIVPALRGLGDLLTRISEIGGRRLPFLRWSVLRMLLGMRNLNRNWQVGDGREESLAAHVLAHARAGDVDDAIRVIDEFCATRSVMINVGDEKGEILDQAVQHASPSLLLELGTYCGYSGLRMARVMPADARLCSLEFSPANAEIARRIWAHAGVGDRLTVLVGTLGDGGATIERLRGEFGFTDGAVDFVFVDHDKSAYLPDIKRILEERWLHSGSVVVADNVKFPGAPEYGAYLKAAEGKTWHTIEHDTHVEYQSLLKDLVLESEYLGEPA
jgi:catechol O-methyltransferase